MQLNKVSCVFSIDKLKVEEGNNNKKIIKGVLNFINIEETGITKETMLFKFATLSDKKVSEIIEVKNDNGIFLGYGRMSKVKNNIYLNIAEINPIDKLKAILTKNNVKEEVEEEQETKDEYNETFEGSGFKPPSIAKGVKL